MKYLLALLLFSAPVFAASVPVTITFNVPSVAYLTDVESSRFLQINNQSVEGALSAPITSGATSIAITGLCPANGTALYLDAEPMLSTAGSGSSTCTVTRNSALSQAGTVAASHASGAKVVELLYPTAQKYFVQVGVQNFMVSLIQSLGANSAVNGSAAASIAAAQASAQAALVGAAQ